MHGKMTKSLLCPLRYKVDFQALQCDDLDDEEFDLDDY